MVVWWLTVTEDTATPFEPRQVVEDERRRDLMVPAYASVERRDATLSTSPLEPLEVEACPFEEGRRVDRCSPGEQPVRPAPEHGGKEFMYAVP